MMTIDNFEAYVDAKILSRGKSYFNKGNVTDLDRVDDQWTATVHGSYEYNVQINTTCQGIETFCDCPYDWGMYCKHEVAVMFAIREDLQSGGQRTQVKSKERQSIHKILDALTQEQLLEIVKEQIKKDKQLANTLLLKYGTEALDKSVYTRMIQGYVNQYSDRGFLGYRESQQVAHAIYTLNAQATEMLDTSTPEKAIPILQAIIETMIDILNQADDSSGELGGCTSEALQTFESLGELLQGDARQELFDYYLEQALNRDYFNWDYGWELIYNAQQLIDKNAIRRDRLFDVLDTLVSKSNSYSRNYQAETTLRYKHEIMQEFGMTPENERQFLLDNVHVDAMRQKLIRLYIDEGNYDDAKKLCDESINTHRANRLHGLVRDYQAFLREIAELQGDNDTLRELLKDEFMQSHNLQLLAKLKEMVGQSEWLSFFGTIVDTIKTDAYTYRRSQTLAKIYAFDNQWDKVIELAKKDHHVFGIYESQLREMFPSVIREIKIGQLEEQFISLRDFSHYQDLKKLVPFDEWDAYAKKLVKKIQPQTHQSNIGILSEIYAQEGWWDKLLKNARKSPNILQQYAKQLNQHVDSEQLCQLYEDAVFKMLQRASNREIYRQAATYLNYMLELDEIERAAEILDTLRAEYPKRKAMLEELEAVST